LKTEVLLIISFLALSMPLMIKAANLRIRKIGSLRISILVLSIISTTSLLFLMWNRYHLVVMEQKDWIVVSIAFIVWCATPLSAYFNWPKNRDNKSLINNQKKIVIKQVVYESNPNNYSTIPKIAGSDGGIKVTIINLTVKMKNGQKKYPDLDFGEWFIEEILSNEKIFAEKRNPLVNRYFCPSCSSILQVDTISNKVINLEMNYKDFPQLKVIIDIPAVECFKCKKICGVEMRADTKGSVLFHLLEAIRIAFENEEVNP
jgi:hypothetical protein